MSDILEEHERSEIRGTLISMAVASAASAATRATALVDPYTREARIWLRHGMSKETIVSFVQLKLGLVNVKEEPGLLYFAPEGATSVIKLVIDTEKCAPHCVTGK